MFYVGDSAIYFTDTNPYNYITEHISEIKIPEGCKKFYAVKKGTIKSICFNWETCKASVTGVSNSEYKSFKNLKDAIEYIGIEIEETLDEEKEEITKTTVKDLIVHPECFAYVDGSFNAEIQYYGYGVVLVNKSDMYKFFGADNQEDMISMRNVSGEILGAQKAIKEAIKLEIKEITIYYDYKGIECWATGEWKRNKKGTIAYHNFIKSVEDKIKINFVKVKAHSGVEFNEIVDKLAKSSVGIF